MKAGPLARAAAAFAAVALVCSIPSLAHAATWTEGTASRAFSLADAGGLVLTTDTADPSLVVPYAARTVYDGAAIEFEPRSIRLLPDGSMLVSTGKHGTILHISKSGTVLKQYTGADIAGLQRPFDAVATTDGGMLIVDRADVQGEGRVFRVDAALHVTWQFGGTSGMGAGQVFDPFTAEQLPGSHTLIADSLGHRVIEVDDATGHIVWSYGQFKVLGSSAGMLNRPHSAQRLSNGDTLICDSENQRVIEVSHAKKIVWSYGAGVAGSGPGQLANPNSATRLSNGDTLICDSDNGRVLEVDGSGKLVQAFGVAGRTPANGSLSDPRAAMRMPDGTTLIADLGHTRLASYGVVAHHEYVATSSPIDPLSAARKRFVSIRVSASVPSGALLAVEYSINSGPWTGLRGTALPSDAIGTNIRYRLRLTTGTGAGPVVRDVSIEWVVAGASSGSTAGSGTKSSTTKGTGTGSGSGSGTGSGTGSGSHTATSTAPGGSTSLPGGATSGGVGGTGGASVTKSDSVSGWVMSEVKDDVTGFGSASVGGAGRGRPSSDSTVPGVVLLLAVYSAGVAWTPTSRVATRLFARIVAAAVSR